ncbi:MAG: hypothetical protein LUH50_22930 [Bacteroides intestinalis]|nr:hypothetical protein [Bacteroides intestinalis]
MLEFSAMKLVWLISAVVTIVLGICMLVINVPKDKALRNYRVARIFAALAYFALSAFVLLALFVVNEPGNGTMPDGDPLEVAIVLIVAPFQALLYTSTLVTLINPSYVSQRRVWGQVGAIIVYFIGSFVTLSVVARSHFNTVVLIATGIYCLQLAFYTILFCGSIGYIAVNWITFTQTQRNADYCG